MLSNELVETAIKLLHSQENFALADAVEELKGEYERQTELANAFHQMANKYLYQNDELKEEVERLQNKIQNLLEEMGDPNDPT